LLVVIYVSLKSAALAKNQTMIAEFLQGELKEIRAAQKISIKPLPMNGLMMASPPMHRAGTRERRLKPRHRTMAPVST
jgi:hypothetical protein